MGLSISDYAFIRDLVYKDSGIVLEAGKDYLIDARMATLVRQLKLTAVEELGPKLRAAGAEVIKRQVVEAMTTNETSFFRDQKPFDALKSDILPELIKSRSISRSLSIWCAASSTGQEPYTIAMTMFDAFPELLNWRLNFIASDLSTAMVDRCKAGKFSAMEVNRGLPAPLLLKYFKRVGLDYEIDERFRKLISFRQQNLLQAWPNLPDLDIVFIRNVLIYFDTNTKKQILGRVRRQLKPDGFLFLGGAETTLGLDDGFERMPIDKSGCYRVKKDSGLLPKSVAA